MNENFEFLRNNFSLDFLLSSSFIFQFIIILSAIGLAFFAEQIIRKNIIKNIAGHKVILTDSFKIIRPIMMLAIIFFSKLYLDIFQPTRLLYIAISLISLLILIRLIVMFMRYILQPGPWIRAMENIIVTFVFLLFVLNAFGALGYVKEVLSGVQFHFANQTFSLLVILEAVTGIFIFVLMAMTIAQFLENRLMKIDNNKLDMNQKIMFSKVLRISLYVIALIVALDTAGVDVTFLSIFGGAFGVGLAFGMQKIASNYICGFIILMDKSVRIGDILKVGEHYGQVSVIKSRFTVLKRLDGIEVVIPNESWISENIINYTFSDRKTKVPLDIQISYSSSVDKAFEIILDAVNDEPRVVDNPKPTVFLKGFADSGIDLHASIYVSDPEEGSLGLKSDLYRKIWKKFQEQGIDIPYPHRTVEVISKENKII